ncbi:TPA: hypothetical protein OUN36_002780 [Clostridioides difficile]|nr:hypothetical protein [Clostridioides difficile]
MNILRELEELGYKLKVREGNIEFEYRGKGVNDYEKSLELLYEVKKRKIRATNYLLCNYKQYKKIIAIDIETTATMPQEGKIVLIAMHDNEGGKVAYDPKEIEDILADEDILKVFHNASFDVVWFEYFGYKVNEYTDTMIMSQVINNRVRQENSLVDVAHKYLNVVMSKQLQDTSNWNNGVITKEHEEYCKRDVEITYKLYFTLMDEIHRLEIYPVLDREIRALPSIIELRRNGIKFEYGKWYMQILEYEREKDMIEKEIKSILNVKDLNLNSPIQVVEILNKFGINVTSSSDEELAKFSDNNEVIKLIRKYKKLKKRISSFGDKLKEKIDNDGCIRGKWNLIGADTFRMTCTSPNLQGMPRVSKEYFVPRNKESVFVIADYSQIELRVLAEISNDKLLIDAFKNGEDLHRKTASMILDKHISEVTDEERSIAKAANFGLIYGMTSYGLQKKIKADYCMEITLEEAEKFRNGYFEAYKDVLKYQDKMLKAEYIETLGGRYWSKETSELDKGSIKRYNYPIQGTSAEGLKEALYLLMKRKPKDWLLVAIVHDEIVLEVPCKDEDVAKEILRDCMVEGMSKMVKKVPIEVDVKSSITWDKP